MAQLALRQLLSKINWHAVVTVGPRLAITGGLGAGINTCAGMFFLTTGCGIHSAITLSFVVSTYAAYLMDRHITFGKYRNNKSRKWHFLGSVLAGLATFASSHGWIPFFLANGDGPLEAWLKEKPIAIVIIIVLKLIFFVYERNHRT